VDEGPYRSAGVTGIACPRCRSPMAGDLAERMACRSGCGEWLPKEALEGLLSWEALEASEPDVASLLGQPFPPVPCPICGRTMAVSVRPWVVFDHCGAHGVWLDRNERERFAHAFDMCLYLLGS